MERCYIEHDGRVLVVDREGTIDLPSVEEVDVPFERYAERRVLGKVDVVFGQAELDDHPHDWPKKDHLAHDPAASQTVYAAINASLFRPVVGVVVRSGDEVLLVKPRRGVATGTWTLPGGFVNAFEHPTDAAHREVREETGLELETLELLGTLTYRHSGAPYPILGLGYVGDAASRDVQIRAEEIAEARWVDPSDALGDASGLARQVLDRLLEGAAP